MCDCCLQEFDERELIQVEENNQLLHFCDDCFTMLTAPTESEPSSTEASEGEAMDEE